MRVVAVSMRAVAVGLSASAFGLMFVAGCETGGAKPWRSAPEVSAEPAPPSIPADEVPPPRPISPVAAIAPEESDRTLAAVAEFLERTRELDEGARTEDARRPAVRRMGGAVASTSPGNADGSAGSAGPGRLSSQPLVEPHGSRENSLASVGAGDTPAETAVRANTQMALDDTAHLERGAAAPRLLSLGVRAVEIDLGNPAEAPSEDPQVNRGVGLPATCKPPSLREFLQALERESQDRKEVDSEWALRLVQMAAEQPIELGTVGAALAPREQAVLRGYLRLGEAVGGMLKRGSGTAEEALERADELRQSLADRAAPRIEAVVACRKVLTFGVYEEMSESEFQPGRAVQTIVYTEVRNLQSALTEEGVFRTVVWTRLELLTADGRLLWEHEAPEIVDTCRTRRTDFFIAQRVTFPPNLPEGEHVLKVSVEDRLSGLVHEVARPLPFRSAGSLAQRSR